MVLQETAAARAAVPKRQKAVVEGHSTMVERSQALRVEQARHVHARGTKGHDGFLLGALHDVGE